MTQSVTNLAVAPFSPLLEPIATQLPLSFREQYLIPVDAPYQVVLGGHMARVWHRPAWLWPVFWFLARGDVLFPETGENIPTTLIITATRDPNGIPIEIWQRTFHFPHQNRRRYTSTMRYDPGTKCVVELQGPGNIFQEDAQVRFTPPATIEWRTVASTLRIGRLRLQLPRRAWISAHIVQQADLARVDTSHITLTLTHGLLGPIFGYEGTFRVARRIRVCTTDPADAD
jgi:hypothetical protein